jgi:S1-C subfamily serine protease
VRRAAGLVAIAAVAGCGGAHRAAPPAVFPVRSTTSATAFALGPGRAITVQHALHGARVVRAGGGRRVRVLAADARDDLALLAVPGLRAPRLATARARAGTKVRVLVVRDTLRTLHATVRRAITARLGAFTRPALELSGAAIQPGDSGAPVLDDDGRLVGVVFAEATRVDRLSYAVAASAVDGFTRR